MTCFTDTNSTFYFPNKLKSMTKDELIELLEVVQHNYERATEALDKACEKLDDLSYESKMYYDGYYQTKEEWRAEFLAEVGI